MGCDWIVDRMRTSVKEAVASDEWLVARKGKSRPQRAPREAGEHRGKQGQSLPQRR